jgi:1-phosphatidylinositol-4-phosphate 5-kinase
MLKTISHQEFELFKFIMITYYYHMLEFPHSLVARILGLHKIKLKRDGKTERIYFVIMANVFNTTREIKVRYDLKGST